MIVGAAPALDAAGWDLPEPYVLGVEARAEHIDIFEHVNNTVWTGWLAEAAWSHSRRDGLDERSCGRHRKGMAMIRTEVDFLAAGKAGERYEVAVWITRVDGGRRAERRYQIRRIGDGRTMVRARHVLMCFDMDKGTLARMPEDFLVHYRVTDQIGAAVAAEDARLAALKDRPPS